MCLYIIALLQMKGRGKFVFPNKRVEVTGVYKVAETVIFNPTFTILVS